jgi:hypothetical protein
MFASAVAAPISLLAGKLTGAASLETKAVTGKILSAGAGEAGEAVAKRGAVEVGKGFAKAGAQEIVQEGVEEGGSTFGQNVGVKLSGAKPDQDLMAGVPEAAGAAGALGLVAGAGFHATNEMRGGSASKDTSADTTTTTPGSEGEIKTKGDSTQFKLTDAEYGAAVNSVPFMAAAYANGNEATRAQLRTANPDLDFDSLTQDQRLLKHGNSLLENNPSFTTAFQERLGQVTPNTNNTPDNTRIPQDEIFGAEPNISNPPSFDESAFRQNRSAYADEISRRKSIEAEHEDDLAQRQVQREAVQAQAMTGLPNQETLLQGYQSRVENLMRLPENYRRSQAEQSVSEMIGRGFTPEQAAQTFAPILNPQAAVNTNTTEDIRPSVNLEFQSFPEMRQRLAERDQARHPQAKPQDYLEVPVAPRIRQLAKAFGINVSGYRYVGTNPVLKSRNGVSMGGGNVLLNTDAKESHIAIFGHELYHELARRNPEAARELEMAILAYVEENKKTDFGKKLKNLGYDPSKVNEEMTADLMGYMFTERAFWVELNEKQPTLIERILAVVDDMIAKFGKPDVRKAEIAGYVSELNAVRTMLAQFVAENSNKQTNAGNTEVNDSIDFTKLSAEDASTAEKVVSLLREKKHLQAGNLFRESGLGQRAGLNMNTLSKEAANPTPKVEAPVEEEPIQSAVSKSEPGSQDAMAPIRARANIQTVLDLLRDAEDRGREKSARNKSLIEAKKFFDDSGLDVFESFPDLQQRVRDENTKKTSSATFTEDDQSSLRLNRKQNPFDAEVADIMSGETVRSKEEKVVKRAQAIANAKGARRAKTDADLDEEYRTESPVATQENDTGAQDTENVEASSKKAAELEAVSENARLMTNRVREIMRSTDRKLAQLASLRQKMKKAGYSDSDIEATIGSAETELTAVRDNDELRKLAEEQITESRTERVTFEDKEPEEYSGSDAIQSDLEIDSQQQRDAAQLVDAVFKKEMDLLGMYRAIRDNGIGAMNVVNAFRLKGLEVPNDLRNLSGNIAANNTLRTHIRESDMNPYLAREAWLKSYDNLPNKGLVELTKTEAAAYKNWKQNREKFINRLPTQAGDISSFGNTTMEELFPNVLFTQFTLNQMKNPETIPEPMRSVVKDLFDDPVKAWKEDISTVLSIRPDFEDQVNQLLTKDEQAAYNEFFLRQVREAYRNMEMKVKSPAYSQLDGLKYLTPELYTQYRAQIGMAEQSQLAAILHEAAALNDKAKMDGGAELMSQHMDQAMHEDEMLSRNPDEIPVSESGEIESIENVLSRFKRGTYSGVVPALTISEHFENVFANWDNRPAYTVVQNPNQLPDDVKQRLTSRFTTNEFKGALDPKTGHIYIFSDFVNSTADAEFTMFHELYGHWGIRAFLGDKMNGFLENQYRLNSQVKEEADRQFKEAQDNGMPMTKLESVEEAISDIAANKDPSLFRELIGRMVAWLRKHGMTNVADWMDSTGHSELAYILGQARKVAREGQGISPLTGAPLSAMYSREKRPKEMFAVRDGNTTGYARLNPITNQWTVFAVKPDGTFGVVSVNDTADAYNTLKKVGAIAKSRALNPNPNLHPKNIHKIPDYNDLTGWAKIKRDMQIGMQNMYLPVFEVARYLEGKGIKNTVIDDMIKYESRLKFYVDDYQTRYLRPITRSLGEIGKKGGSVEDVDLFLMARHAEERNKAIGKINPTNQQGSGISTDEARKILSSKNNGAWTSFMTELEEIGKLTDAMSTAKLAYMYNTGLINKHQLAALSKYKHYVNLSGNQDLGLDAYDGSQLGGKAFNIKGAEFIRSTGRGTKAVDVLTNSMNSYLSTLIRGQKNRPMQAMLNMVRQNPDPTYVVIDPIKEKKKVNLERLSFDKKILAAIGDKPGEQFGRDHLKLLKTEVESGNMTIDEALDDLESRINEAANRRDIDGNEASTAIRRLTEEVVSSAMLSPDGYVSMVDDPTLMQDPSVIVAKEEGRPVVMRFNKRASEFVQSITGMNIQERTGFMEFVGGWNRFFSQMVTSWNPAWVPVNGIRDIQTAIANMAADPNLGPGMAAKMTAEWRKSLQTAFRYQVADQADANNGFWGKYLKSRSKKHPIDPAEAKLYAEYREDGAETFFLDRDGLEQTLEKMNRHINGPQGLREMTEDKLEAIGNFMELFSMPMETAPRFAAYKVMREAGKSREEAARYAKELTINFNMKGKWRDLRNLYVFFNPAVQGTYRMFQNYSRSETGVGKYLPSNQFAKVAGLWMLFGIAANMMARALGGKDDEKPGIDKLDMIPAYRRATSLVLVPDMYGGAIPVAYGWNVFMTAGQYMFDAMTGKLKPDVAAGRVLSAAFDAFAPIGSGAESKSLAGSVAKTFAPSPVVPLVEIATNENRFGAPIYKDSKYSNVKQSDAYMHFDSVNPISKALMHGLAQATSGGRNPRYNEALIDVNPATVDHMINSYLPGLFSEAYKTAGVAIQAASGRNTKDLGLPLVERFKAKVPDGFDNAAFRRVSEDVTTKYKEYMAPDTPKERRVQIAKEYKNLGGVQALMTGVDQQIRSMNSSLQAIETNPRYTEAEKVAYRNKIEDDTKAYRNRAVKMAIQAGFRDAVIDNKSQGFVDQTGAIVNQVSSSPGSED